jgi:glycosyltransferase involved in cell wall biosynthesis
VLAAKTGGVPEIINSPRIGRLVSDFTPAAFARTMLEMLTLPDRGGVMAAKAQESVGQRFDSPVSSEKLGSIYADVLGPVNPL